MKKETKMRSMLFHSVVFFFFFFFVTSQLSPSPAFQAYHASHGLDRSLSPLGLDFELSSSSFTHPLSLILHTCTRSPLEVDM